jgi:uncharacterized membrane protein YqiK
VQKVLANKIDREREKTITQQNVEANEAILELNRQYTESEEKQKREIATIKSREEAEAKKVQEEQRLRSEQARIAVEEELMIAEENKSRQIIVAQRNKERTDAIEKERVEKDRQIEVTERERIIALARIDKDKAVEIQQKAIQNVIRERLEVEKTVVIEQQRIKDTEAFATAERDRKVAVIAAEREAEQALVKDIKAAEAARKAAEQKAEQERFTVIRRAEASKEAAERHSQEVMIEADAAQGAAVKQSAAKKMLAEALTAETAAPGLAEVQILEARAAATQKQGSAEAEVMELKASAEAKGITEKAEAMKLLDEVGRDHEEFKLRLNKERDIELAQIHAQQEIASSQAHVLGEALKNAKIDIVGGETQFFDRITNAITGAKVVDRMVQGSSTLTDIKESFFNSDPAYFDSQIRGFFDRFGLSSEDLKNLSISAALGQMLTLTEDQKTKGLLSSLLSQARRLGVADEKASSVGKDPNGRIGSVSSVG